MPSVPLSQVAVHLRPEDNVAVAARHLAQDQELQVNGRTIKLGSKVGLGHKLAVRDIKKGEAVYKYGQIIGFASKDIPAGQPRARPQRRRRQLRARLRLLPGLPGRADAAAAALFRGLSTAAANAPNPYASARATTSPSSARSTARPAPASTSRERFHATDILKNYPNVDGVVAITHKAGCAMQYDGPDHHQLDRTLAGFAKHPNVAAYILIGLGCETGQAIHLIENERSRSSSNGTQEAAARAVDSGMRRHRAKRSMPASSAIAELLPRVNDVQRTQAARQAPDPRHQLRRLRRQQRRHRQPRPRRRLRPARRPGRHQRSSAKRPRSTAPSIC